MPVWLRRFNLMKINEVIKQQQDAQNGKTQPPDVNKIPQLPKEIKDSYIRKNNIPIKSSNSKKSK